MRLRKKLNWAVIYLVSILLFLGLFYPSKTFSETSEKEQVYKIQDGETLWSIAEKFYNNGFDWTYVATRNNISDPSNVPTGRTLFIPSLSSKYAKPQEEGHIFTGPTPIARVQEQNKVVLGADQISLEDAVLADLAMRHYLPNVSVYSYDGKAESTISINANRQWVPASTVKAFVAMYAYDQVYKGKLSLDDLVLVDAKNVVPTELVTSELLTLSEGEYVSISRLITQMLTQSDNTSYNILLDVLDRRNINEFIHSLGLTNSSVGSKLNLDNIQQSYELNTPGYGFNTTTANDYSTAFQLMENGKISGSGELITILSQQKLNNMIPLFLPKSAKVAHKTGELDPLYHDGGIVTGPSRKYVLSIFTNTGDPIIVAHISDLVYSKNFDLIGVNEKESPVSEATSDQGLDPLVAQNSQNSQVLAALKVPTPVITAADLGIKASDLNQPIRTNSLPRVFLPADSPLHFVVSGLQNFRKAIAFTPAAQVNANLSSANLKLAEAKDLQKRGKVTQANAILKEFQSEIQTAAKSKAISNDPKTQSTIQSLSETRFSILSDELKGAKGGDRIKLIKEIATQARQTVKEIQPNIPNTNNAANPEQKPIVAEVISSNSTSIKVRTAGGQELEIPNQEVKIRDRAKAATTSSQSATTTTVVSTLSTLKEGTTVALLGTSIGGTFVPSFVLKNAPRELVAPRPVTVIKVDEKKKTMVVSENGVTVQVNLKKDAVIKGSDTNVSLKGIKQGDIVVVRGEEVKNTPPPPTPVIVRPSPAAGTITPENPPTPAPATPTIQNVPTTGAKTPSAAPSLPKVIRGNSVQVIQKKENVSKPAAAKPSKPGGKNTKK